MSGITSGLRLRNPKFFGFLLVFMLFQLVAAHSLASQVPDVVVDDVGYVDGQRPAACPGQAIWSSFLSPGDVEVDGYYFAANPFNLSRWITQTDGIYNSSKGYSIIDRSGRKRWTNARVIASCWRADFAGLHAWWAHWERPLGTVEGCVQSGGGSGGFQLVNDDGSPAYDPYDPESCSDVSNSPSGNGGSGSGTQFSEGDHTGGETVDWNTGVGDGGTSMCGADAVVEFLCIDVLTEEGWHQWSCGYVTSC